MKKLLLMVVLTILPLAACASGNHPPQQTPHELHGTLPSPCSEWILFEALSLEEAQLDPDFGTFMPTNIPDNFSLRGAVRVENIDDHPFINHWQVRNGIYLLWNGPDRQVGEEFFTSELIWLVSDVVMETGWIIPADELSLDFVRARVQYLAYRYGHTRWMTEDLGFGVIFDDVLVRVRNRPLAGASLGAL